MKQKHLLLYLLPPFWGGIFTGTVLINQALFRRAVMGVRFSIALEFLILILGLSHCVFVVIWGCKHRPIWKNLIYASVSVFVFFILIMIGISQGAALVYAT